MNKKLLLLAVFLMSMVAISAASAAENTTDEISEVSKDTDNLEIVQEDELGIYLDNSFRALQERINGAAPNSTLTLDKDYKFYSGDYWDKDYAYIGFDKDLTIDGDGHTVDADGKRNVFKVHGGNVTLKNIRIINGHDEYLYGGGVYVDGGSCTAIGCTFENNNATQGGAMYGGTAINCTFKSNYADAQGSQGGAMYGGTAINCVFIENKVIHWEYGGEGGALSESTAINCVFINNTADRSGDAMFGGTADSCIFENNGWDGTDIRQPSFEVSDYSSSCWSGDRLQFNLKANTTDYLIVNRNINVTIYGENRERMFDFACPSGSWFVDLPAGQYIAECVATDYPGIEGRNVTLKISQSDSAVKVNSYNFTVDYNDIMFEITLPKIATGNMTVTLNGNTSTFNVSEKGIVEDRIRTMTWRNAFLPVGQYNMAVSYSGDRNFKPAAFNVTSYILPLSVELSINATSSLYVGNTTKIEYNITPSGLNGTLTFESSNPQVATVDSNGTITAVGGGTAIITASYWVSENYTNPKANITVSVNRLGSQINADPVATTYNVDRDLLITLTDAKGNPLSGLNVTVMFDDAGEYATDENGQVGVNVANLVPKTYNAIITFPGNSVYLNSTCSVNVTVMKATPKLIADSVAATYNVNRDLVVTLTDAKGNSLSGLKVTVMFDDAVEYATGNNGQIRVNVANLVPKTYNVKITFPGNSAHVNSTCSVKVTVKKATPKLIAKKKTYKAKTKAKKFTITLKDNKGKAIRNAKVWISIKKITKKAKAVKTNAKGKATLKFSKSKKGKYLVTIKFKANKYYSSVTKKVKITIR